MYQAIASDRFRAAHDRAFDRETGFELYYALTLRPGLVVTPDLQWILNPGWTGEGRNAAILPTDAYVVQFGKSLAGVMMPASRQAVGRWIRRINSNEDARALSGYLLTAERYAEMDAGRHGAGS